MTEDERKARRRTLAQTECRARLLDWYMQNSGGKPPILQVEDRKSYNGIVMYWLEPKLPDCDNVVMIEEDLEDGYSIRFEKL